MDVQNELANRIDSYSNWARYDAACKRLLANKQVLARILKSCVPEFYDCDCKDIESKYIEGTPEKLKDVLEQLHDRAEKEEGKDE